MEASDPEPPLERPVRIDRCAAPNPVMLTFSRVPPHEVARLGPLLRASGLTAVGLPGEGVRVVAIDDGQHVRACAAVEVLDDTGLLRSVAVSTDLRGHGLGREIVAAAEAEARQAGVAMLYLLTETAAGFFSRLGYRPIPRPDVPESIRRSRQFTELCPESAVIMVRNLDPKD